MTKTELLELLKNGENSGVEFTRDDQHPDAVAKEIAALLNLEGGYVLLGIEDDRTISGLTREPQLAEEWVMNICRHSIQPPIIPYWEIIHCEDNRVVGVISLPADSPDKPYKGRRGHTWVTFVRVGSTSREATREEEARLYQASQLMRYDIKPVLGTGLDDLDMNHLDNYFRDVLRRDAPDSQNSEGWRRLLLNVDILTEAAGMTVATLAGLVLFGESPNRRLPQAGITATAFPREDKAYDTVDEEVIRGPLVSIISKRGRVLEKGVIDRAVDFVTRNMGTIAWLEEGRRQRKKSLPQDAVREGIVNAAAHRDYTIIGTDIEVSLYRDRLEIISPGRLPNGVTVQKMKEGFRAARNELLKEILRDYGYIEHRGMGVRNRIIQPMREHNGTEPDLVEEESRFIVRLWKGPRRT